MSGEEAKVATGAYHCENGHVFMVKSPKAASAD
jgi:hypothetical protein